MTAEGRCGTRSATGRPDREIVMVSPASRIVVSQLTCRMSGTNADAGDVAAPYLHQKMDQLATTPRMVGAAATW